MRDFTARVVACYSLFQVEGRLVESRSHQPINFGDSRRTSIKFLALWANLFKLSQHQTLPSASSRFERRTSLKEWLSSVETPPTKFKSRRPWLIN